VLVSQEVVEASSGATSPSGRSARSSSRGWPVPCACTQLPGLA